MYVLGCAPRQNTLDTGSVLKKKKNRDKIKGKKKNLIKHLHGYPLHRIHNTCIYIYMTIITFYCSMGALCIIGISGVMRSSCERKREGLE